MAQERLPMRKVCDVLRLKAAGLVKRKIAANLGISAAAAGACLRRAQEAAIAWPAGRGDDRGGAGSAALPGLCGAGPTCGAASTTQLGGDPSGEQAVAKYSSVNEPRSSNGTLVGSSVLVRPGRPVAPASIERERTRW